MLTVEPNFDDTSLFGKTLTFAGFCYVLVLSVIMSGFHRGGFGLPLVKFRVEGVDVLAVELLGSKTQRFSKTGRLK